MKVKKGLTKEKLGLISKVNRAEREEVCAEHIDTEQLGSGTGPGYLRECRVINRKWNVIDCLF